MNLMKEKVYVLKVMLVDHNMICSLRIEKKKFMCCVSFRDEDDDDLRKHMHLDHNMILLFKWKGAKVHVLYII